MKEGVPKTITENSTLAYWHENSEQQAKQFGNTIDAHDYLNPVVFRLTQQYIVNLFEGREQLRILDVGCGNGLFTKPLNDKNQVFGIDVSTSMLSLARQNGTVSIRSLAEKLPFKDSSFDGAVSNEMFQCVENGDAITREMARVLRPGGILAIQTLNDSSIIRRFHRCFDKESKALKMYKVGEVMKFMELPDLESPRVIYNYYPFRRASKQRENGLFGNLLATSFAVVSRKK